MLVYIAFLVGVTYLFYWKEVNKLSGRLFKKKAITDNSTQDKDYAEEGQIGVV